MKRTTPLSRGTARLSRGGGTLKRTTRIAKKGARKKRERSAEERCRAAVMRRARGRCERCNRRTDLDHHHMNRRRGRTPEEKHNPRTSAALCRPCHTEVRAGSDDSANWFVETPLWASGGAA